MLGPILNETCHPEALFAEGSLASQRRSFGRGRTLPQDDTLGHVILRRSLPTPAPAGRCRGDDIEVVTMIKEYYVYIITNQSPTLYTGMTSNLMRRVYEHKNKLVKGFTSKYHIHSLA